MSAVASQPSRPHAALIWLIRGTYLILVAIGLPLLLVVILNADLWKFFKDLIDAANPSGSQILAVLVGLTFILAYGVIIKRCYRSIRENFWTIKTAAGSFSILFAFLLAVDLFHWLPFVSHDFGVLALLVFFLAFYLFNKVIDVYLFRVLELNPPSQPKDPPIAPVSPNSLKKVR